MPSRTHKQIALTAAFLAAFTIGLGLSPDTFAPRTAAAPLAATWPSSLTLTPVASGLTHPTDIAHAGDGSGRIFVLEQPGRIRIVKGGVLQPTPFLDITARVNSTGGEQGLLGIAFPPNYASKKYFYVNYTNKTGAGNTVIARYRLTANPDVADPNSEELVLEITQPFVNHNGGQLHFGPDGYLYIGMGDGGSGGDPQNNAQTPSVLLGKMLRIDTEPTQSPSLPSLGPFLSYLPLILRPSGAFTYTIPATNPYTQTTGYRGEVWALGLRNPWRFSFDRATGDLYIADVGQGAWEEISFQSAASPGGENYGWRILEAAHCYNPSSGCVPPSRYAAPVAEYDHSVGCSIAGGYVYRGPGNAAMQGIYLYGDYCSGRIWGLQRDAGTWQTRELTHTTFFISTFGEDQSGNLYVAGYNNGVIYQITTP